jgi:hypothetical protein
VYRFDVVNRSVSGVSTSFPVFTFILIVVIAYCIGAVFMEVFGQIIDTLLLCFCEDTEHVISPSQSAAFVSQLRCKCIVLMPRPARAKVRSILPQVINGAFRIQQSCSKRVISCRASVSVLVLRSFKHNDSRGTNKTTDFHLQNLSADLSATNNSHVTVTRVPVLLILVFKKVVDGQFLVAVAQKKCLRNA